MNQYLVTMVCGIVMLLLLMETGSAQDNCQSHTENASNCHLLEQVQTQLNRLQEAFDDLPKTSCAEVKNLLPDSSSGYYDILVEGENHTVYCNMDELCGDSGGWMRVGYLNMTDENETCPSGFQTYDINGTKSCGRPPSITECQSVNFTTYGVKYTQVCGRVTGYQKGSPDGFEGDQIDEAYVDGVSITRGSPPRKHIWTYIASRNENDRLCPCDEGSTSITRTFVGEEYFCETAREENFDLSTLYTDDLLWDGKQCGDVQAACCEASRNMPWFKKVLDAPSTDFIELRVCCDNNDNEDIAVNFFKIYVK